MAKKSASGNKSAAIREALQANPDKGPKEIAEIVQAQGFKVNAQYVSIIKSNDKKSSGGQGRKVVVRRKVGRPAGRGRGPGAAASGIGSMEAAITFVQAAGGLEQAKQALTMLETIRAAI